MASRKGTDSGLTPKDDRAEGADVGVTGAQCRHDSMRVDGLLDACCLKCGADGYWHDGHRHDEVHPSGKVLFRLDHPLANSEPESAERDPQSCGRLLVGQGTDTWDPLCTRPAGHAGRCESEDEPPSPSVAKEV